VKNLLIAVLLVTSVALGALSFWRGGQLSSVEARVAELETALKKKDAAATKTTSGQRRVLSQVVTNETLKQVDWRSVESDDYKKYIANLRSIGCPEETIKDIIVADVNKLFESRRKALKPPGERFQFWKSGPTARSGPDEERLNQLQALAKEKRALLRELLGVEVADPQDALAAMTSQITDMLGFLPSEKQAQVLELEQRYAARLAKFSGQTNEAAVASIRAIQAEKEAELNALLSPAERETYDLTTSRTASTMRSQLGDFDPNEQEFRDIFKARRKLDEEFRRFSDQNDPASRDGREAALLAAYDEIHKALGDARWADYRSAREWQTGSALRQIAEAEGIAKSEAMKVPDIRDAALIQALRLRADRNLSAGQFQTAMQAVQAETRNAIIGVLGPKAGGTLLDNPATKSWLGEMARQSRSKQP
jgi:hypothetical protein